MATERHTIEIEFTDNGTLRVFETGGRSIGEFTARVEDAGRKVDSAKGFFDSFAGAATGFNQALELASKGLNAARSAAEFFFQGINRGGELDDLNKRLGVSVEQTSAYELALRAAGVERETFALGIRTLSTNMAAAAAGNEQAQATFAKLGVSVTDASGALKSADTVMLEVADKLSAMDAGVARTTASMEVFGSRAGSTLLTFLSEGSEGLERFNQLSRDFGLVLTPESAAAMDSIGDNLTIIGAAAEGVAQQFAVGLAPALSEITDEVVQMVASFGIGNGTIEGFGRAVGDSLQGVVSNIREAIESINSLGPNASFGDMIAAIAPDLAAAAGNAGLAVGEALANATVEGAAAIWRAAGWEQVLTLSFMTAVGGARGAALAIVGQAIMKGLESGAIEEAPPTAGTIVERLRGEMLDQAQSTSGESAPIWEALLGVGVGAGGTIVGNIVARKVEEQVMPAIWTALGAAAAKAAGGSALATVGTGLAVALGTLFTVEKVASMWGSSDVEQGTREALSKALSGGADAAIKDLESFLGGRGKLGGEWWVKGTGLSDLTEEVRAQAVPAIEQLVSEMKAADGVSDALGISFEQSSHYLDLHAKSAGDAATGTEKVGTAAVATTGYLSGLKQELVEAAQAMDQAATASGVMASFLENLANTKVGSPDFREAQEQAAAIRTLMDQGGLTATEAQQAAAAQSELYLAALRQIGAQEQANSQQRRVDENIESAAADSRIAALREGITVKGLELGQAQQYATLMEERKKLELTIIDPGARQAALAAQDAKIARLMQEGKIVAELTGGYSKSQAASQAFNAEVLKLQSGLAVQEKYNEVLEERLAAGDSIASATEEATEASKAYGEQLALEGKYGEANAVVLQRIIDLTREKAEEARRAAAIATIEQDTAALAAQIPIMQAAIAGTISRAQAEHQIAVEIERQNLLRAKVAPEDASRLAEEAVRTREEWETVSEQFDAIGEKGVSVGALIGDAFSQTLDGIIAGTLDFGKVWESFTVSMGKQLFENLWNEKLNFDEGFKFNILDLLDWTKGTADSTGGLFDGLLGGGSGGGSPLSLLTGGGGGGGFLAAALPWILGGAGAGGGHGTAGLLAGAGTGALWSGSGQFAISNFGQDTLALLGGETFAGTVGDWAANSGWFSPTWGGQAFGGGSVAGSFGGGAIGSAASGVVSAGLGYGASIGGQATADAFGIKGLYGTEGQIHMAIGNTVAQIIGNYFGGPLGGAVLTYLNEILQPLLFDALGIAQAPTKGTMQRRSGESFLDSIPTFGTLQEQFGDVSRKRYRVEDADWLPDSRERLGEEAMGDISGFAGIFAQMMGGEVDGGGRVAGMVEEWTNILTDFFGRMDTDAEGTGLAIRQHLAQAFREMGVDAGDAMEVVNKLGSNLLFAGGAVNVDYFGESVSNVTNLGEAVRGTASIFESELPDGVHIAALALESMTRDGATAFGDLDREGHDTLVNLAEDAENFDKILAHLFEQGFTIDTEAFEERLAAIVDSVTFLGEHMGTLLSFENVGVGVNALMGELKGTVLQTYQEIASKQLFENTNFGAVFEPVFAALNRIEEFDLTTATGSKGFMDLLLPALAEGEANLRDYIPVIQMMADNWKEIEKIIAEATAPDNFEKAAIAVEQVLGGLGGILEASLTAGIAVLANGGTYQQALDVFKGSFAAGVESALKEAAFNAMVETVVLQPLIQKWQPALSYVMTAGIANGFDDPKVREAWRIVLAGLGDDAEALAPLVFDARLELEGDDAKTKRFFSTLQESVDSIGQSLSGGIAGLIRESIDIGIEDGLQAGQRHFAENIGDVMYDVLLDAIISAFVDAVIVEGILGPAIAEGAALYAAAHDPNGPGGAFVTPEEQAGINEWRTYFRGVFDIAREEAIDFGNWLVEEGVPLQDPEGGNPHDGYNTSRRPTGDVDTIDVDGRRGRDSRGPYDAETEGRRVVDETVKPPAEALADVIETEVIPGLSNFTDSVEDATKALRDMLIESGSAPPGDDTTGGGRGFPGGRGILDGAAAHGGTFGPGSTFLVGEEGPEVVVYGDDGSVEVIPIDRAMMQRLLDGGVPGYARGTGRPSIGDFRGGRGGTRSPGGGGGGSGWGTGGPFVGADDARNPNNNPNSKVGPVDVEITLNLDEAIEDFLRGGSLSDFEGALKKQAREGVVQGLIDGMLESGPIAKAIEAFNVQMSAQVEKAMKDGIITAQEQADLDALATKLEGGIEDATKKMAPVVEGVGKALGIGIESSTKEAIDGFSNGLEDSLRTFFEGGSIDDVEQSLNEAVYDAFTSGIIQALLTTGPLGKLIDDFGTDFGEAFADAMDEKSPGGKLITPEEEANLRDLATTFGGDMSAAIAILGPVYGPMFQQWAEDFGVTLESKVAGIDQMLGGAIRSALLNGDTFAEFSKNAREALYGSIVDGLVQAFIDSAVINGLLAGPLAAINQIFVDIGEGQITIAEANARLLVQTDLIQKLLKDPTFEQAWNLVMDAADDVRGSLGVSLTETSDNVDRATDSFNSAADAAANACTGECELQKKTIEHGSTVLDESGRTGEITDTVWEEQHRDKPTSGAKKYDPLDTLGGDGEYGFTGTDADWRRSQRWQRRYLRDEEENRGDDGWMPGYYGRPRDIPRFGKGGVVDKPTIGLIGEAGPELIIPLSALRDFTSGSVDRRVIEELQASTGAFESIMAGKDSALADAVAALSESFEIEKRRGDDLQRALQEMTGATVRDIREAPPAGAGGGDAALASEMIAEFRHMRRAVEAQEASSREGRREIAQLAQAIASQPVELTARVGDDVLLEIVARAIRIARESGWDLGI